ncbi:MAG: activase [Spirochaetes bacterium]|nr:activase [Spirochaetota bacterium]
MHIKSLGINFGASAVKVVELIKTDDSFKVGKIINCSHKKNPFETFNEIISKINLDEFDFGILTGRKIKNLINIDNITEPEAIEYGINYLIDQKKVEKSFNAVASLGAENFIVYKLNNFFNIQKVETENKCASGTGEFFLQQIERINLKLDDAVELANSCEPYDISGRCSVYCKSDCTHALNKGVPVGNVIAGLSRMMADKILYLLKKIKDENVLFIGGVTRNLSVMNFLSKSINNYMIPEESHVFEALGAAYYALINKTKLNIDKNHVFKKQPVTFNFLSKIDNVQNMVEFKTVKYHKAENNDECILGLDVGSTTTKALIIRTNDDNILASSYLRTNGSPVQAGRNCYKELSEKINKKIKIIGLGVTGSGRKIAGIHAQTESVINEIIAHSTGAAYFDKEVDTIFEIGGQDAKYMYLSNGVPVDYAMNEACSAGTGSFIEEAVKNNFNIDFTDIEKIALQSKRPPNFNDQCSAFISSDIQTAIQEGIDNHDIIAGLIYSVCFNYLNKVKSQRQIGNKIFMQGGVCYNKAVPLAMAKILNRKIIVPPEPGLLGAFGVALEVKNRISSRQIEKKSFNLVELRDRAINYGKEFICKDPHCDRKCKIITVKIDNNIYPFGGACNKYDNIINKSDIKIDQLNFINTRNNLIFKKYAKENSIKKSESKKIGVLKSFLTNHLYPLFFNFFDNLGFNVLLSDEIDKEGLDFKNNSNCFPLEISHGYFYNLLKKEIDFIFLPKVVELYVENSISYKKERQCSCLTLQSEAYILKSAFKEEFAKYKTVILEQEFNFSQGFDTQKEAFAELALSLGKSKKDALDSYKYALNIFNKFKEEKKIIGKKILDEIKKSGETVIVLFGRPYNAMSNDINYSIPEKIAALGYKILPWDFLPYENEYCFEYMTWAFGQELIKASYFVRKHPQLFGLYYTNFSCGPDSFLLGYFREIMEDKPSLTLETDSHTADTGINTRIEAFIDIIDRFLKTPDKTVKNKNDFNPAKIVIEDAQGFFITSYNEKIPMKNSDVKILIPSMGEYSSQLLADTFTSVGIKSVVMPLYDQEAFKLGRENTIGKECLPVILVIGGLLKYIKYNYKENDKLAFFMPSNPGNCRFTQYSVFINKLIIKLQLKNVALFSLSPENGYGGMPMAGMISFLKTLVVADVMDDVKNALYVLAKNRDRAMEILNEQWFEIRRSMQRYWAKGLWKSLQKASKTLKKVPLKNKLSRSKKIALLGDFFARRDDFCCQNLQETLAKNNIIMLREHLTGFFKYVDYLIDKKVIQDDFSNIMERVQFFVKKQLFNHIEKKVKRIMSKSGLYEYDFIDVNKIMNYGKKFFSIRYTGEQVLVIGNFYKEILKRVHGAISLSPFACMPMKVVEAILSKEATLDKKAEIEKKSKVHYKKYKDVDSLPFLSIETDGNPFPQVIDARLEAFCLQVERIYRKGK